MIANQRDANQSEIVQGLTALGFSVADLSRVGGGIPDLIVAGTHRATGQQVNLLVEIKTATGKLRPGQVEFIQEWSGPVLIARTLDDILRWFGAI